MKDYFSAANFLTSGNLLAGFLALVLAARGEPVWAAAMIGAAGVFDSVDGIAARRSRAESVFGSRLDSLADLISFGAAPALILYSFSLHRLPVLGIAACMAFLLCGAWRLARFSLLENRHHFVGFPIPPAAVIVVGLVVVSAPPPVVWLAVAVLSGLMVSSVPVPTLGSLVAPFGRSSRAELDLSSTGDGGEEAPRASG